MDGRSNCGKSQVIGATMMLKLRLCFFAVFALYFFGMIDDVHAKSEQYGTYAKSNSKKTGGKSSNEKDILISKNTQATLYLLSGWRRANEPFVWYTVSAFFNSDQLAPNGKPFNLFGISGAQDCAENNFFYYQVTYMLFDAKTKKLSEVYMQKNKTNLMGVEPNSIEADVNKIICY
jgi:hypothetical protein